MKLVYCLFIAVSTVIVAVILFTNGFK